MSSKCRPTGKVQPKPQAMPPVPEVGEKQETNIITNHQVTPGVCRHCNVAVMSLRRHALRVHLPWYFYPEIACWKCKRACVYASELRCRHLSRHPERMFNNPAQLGEWLTTLCGYVKLQASLLRATWKISWPTFPTIKKRRASTSKSHHCRWP